MTPHAPVSTQGHLPTRPPGPRGHHAPAGHPPHPRKHNTTLYHPTTHQNRHPTTPKHTPATPRGKGMGWEPASAKRTNKENTTPRGSHGGGWLPLPWSPWFRYVHLGWGGAARGAPGFPGGTGDTYVVAPPLWGRGIPVEGAPRRGAPCSCSLPSTSWSPRGGASPLSGCRRRLPPQGPPCLRVGRHPPVGHLGKPGTALATWPRSQLGSLVFLVHLVSLGHLASRCTPGTPEPGHLATQRHLG